MVQFSSFFNHNMHSRAIIQAVILCGGKGTRLSTLYSDRPKIMVPIANRPFLEWQLEWLGRQDITDIHLAAGYKAEVLREWLAQQKKSEVSPASERCSGFSKELSANVQQPTSNNQRRRRSWPFVGRWTLDVDRWALNDSETRSQKSEVRGGVVASGPSPVINQQLSVPVSSLIPIQISGFKFQVSSSTEPLPLGTGGGLKFIIPWLRSDPFLVINGDSLVPNLDFNDLEQVHRRSGRPITITVTRIEGTGRYGTVEFDHSGCITAFREKADRTEGWVNAGIYVVSNQVLREIPDGKPVSIETDTFPTLVQQGLLNAYQCRPPLLDMGTPEGIRAMESHLTPST